MSGHKWYSFPPLLTQAENDQVCDQDTLTQLRYVLWHTSFQKGQPNYGWPKKDQADWEAYHLHIITEDRVKELIFRAERKKYERVQFQWCLFVTKLLHQ